MSRQIGMKLKQRAKPTDLYCKVCLGELITLGDLEKKYLRCEHCNSSRTRSQALTFNEMIEAKFERVKQRNINILKG